MPPQTSFDDVLDAVEHLPPDQQVELLEVIRRRLAERGRQQVVEDVRDARSDFQNQKAMPTNVEDLLREIGS